MTALLVVLGAAIGGALRYAVTTAYDDDWPTGTLLVNLAGSALLGLSTALALGGHAWALLAVGFCGSLTTFSSFVVQAVDRPVAPGAAYVAATVSGSLLTCGGGWWLGTAWG